MGYSMGSLMGANMRPMGSPMRLSRVISMGSPSGRPWAFARWNIQLPQGVPWKVP